MEGGLVRASPGAPGAGFLEYLLSDMEERAEVGYVRRRLGRLLGGRGTQEGL